jgi:hypothetical protein
MVFFFGIGPCPLRTIITKLNPGIIILIAKPFRPRRRQLLRFLKLALIFELSTILGLSVLTGQFFYRAYNNSSHEHLPVSFLAALVMLVLGTQQTAMSFRREKVRLAFGRPTVQEKLRLKVAYSTLTLLLFIAAGVLLVILKSHLQ